VFPPRTKALIALPALAALGVLGLAGCSSSTTPATSNVGLSDTKLLAAFKAAVASGTAVHVSGALSSSGSSTTLDLQLNKDGSASGEIGEGGATIPVKVVNGVTYTELTAAFLNLMAASDKSITAAEISTMQNQWVSSSDSTLGQSLASSFEGLTSYDTFTSTMEKGDSTSTASASASASATASASASASGTAGSGGVDLTKMTADGTTTFNGATVAVYKDADGSTAYFAASGPAYLLKATSTGSDGGSMTFTWNQPTTVVAPSAA